MNETTVNTALTIFNEVYKNITERKEKIEINKSKIRTLQGAVDEYDDLNMENRELKKEIKADRDLAKQTIDFYEKASGESVDTGDLFHHDKEDQGN